VLICCPIGYPLFENRLSCRLRYLPKTTDKKTLIDVEHKQFPEQKKKNKMITACVSVLPINKKSGKNKILSKHSMRIDCFMNKTFPRPNERFHASPGHLTFDLVHTKVRLLAKSMRILYALVWRNKAKPQVFCLCYK
jgi:hypothetical protein